MQNEDDLRGLAKVMEFMRAISILFVVINIYWFCYQSVREWGIDIGVVDRILLGFQRTAGLFSNILWTKLFAVLFLALSCLGTKGVKEQKITWRRIILCGVSGLLLRMATTPCSSRLMPTTTASRARLSRLSLTRSSASRRIRNSHT